jgi:hypothetical protein
MLPDPADISGPDQLAKQLLSSRRQDAPMPTDAELREFLTHLNPDIPPEDDEVTKLRQAVRSLYRPLPPLP